MPRFPLGQVVATPGALAALEAARADLLDLLRRHAQGDWGDIEPDDRRANDEAVTNGDRILSAYTLSGDVRVWLITEADRSVTTLPLPEEH
jgi:hypothetical protein